MREEVAAKAVGFSVTEPEPEKKMSVWEEVQAKYALTHVQMARQKKLGGGTGSGALISSKSFTNGSSDTLFSVPEGFRTLDSVKGLPRSRSTPGARSGGARSEQISRASTSLTARSAVQITADRAFKEGAQPQRSVVCRSCAVPCCSSTVSWHLCHAPIAVSRSRLFSRSSTAPTPTPVSTRLPRVVRAQAS